MLERERTGLSCVWVMIGRAGVLCKGGICKDISESVLQDNAGLSCA